MWSYSRLGLVSAQSIMHITFQLYDVLRFEFHHHRVSCTAPVGALCVEPTIFTRARHLSRTCARGSIAAGSRPSWSRSRYSLLHKIVVSNSQRRRYFEYDVTMPWTFSVFFMTLAEHQNYSL